MASTISLPSSNFRIATLIVLAAITVGVTFVDVDINEDSDVAAAAAPASSTTAPDIGLAASTTTPGASPAEVVAALPNSTPATSTPSSTSPSIVPSTTVGADVEPAPLLAPGSPLVFDFAGGSTGWTSLAGDWSVENEQYVQNDGNGFDYISQLDVDLPNEYSVSVEMTAIDTPLGGGLLLGQPTQGSRRGATLIDFTNDGMFLRWGDYDAGTGAHQYRGGLAMDENFDPSATHVLMVEVRSTRTRVYIDGEPTGDFAPIPPGFPGLAASMSAVAFDNFTIAQL